MSLTGWQVSRSAVAQPLLFQGAVMNLIRPPLPVTSGAQYAAAGCECALSRGLQRIGTATCLTLEPEATQQAPPVTGLSPSVEMLTNQLKERE